MNLIKARKVSHKQSHSDRKNRGELLKVAMELGKCISESKNFGSLLFYAKSVMDFSEGNMHTCVFFMEQIHKRMGQLIEKHKKENA